jgi:hypothetical protein
MKKFEEKAIPLIFRHEGNSKIFNYSEYEVNP